MDRGAWAKVHVQRVGHNWATNTHTKQQGSNFSTFHPTLAIFSFNNRHANRCEVVSCIFI